MAIDDTMTLTSAEMAVSLDCGEDGDGLGVLAAGDSLTCTYSVDTSSAAAGTNDVVVSTLIRDYDASANVAWGAPSAQVNETVSLTDIGDLSGTKTDTFTAPAGGTLEYSVPLAYADYGQAECGTRTYGNVATLTGDTVDLEASADVTVKVQCLVFDDETAWAAGSRYTKKGNWATYTPYAGVEKTVDLFAGQTMDAGDVTLSAVVDGKVTITVDLADGWDFAASPENLTIMGYNSAPGGNPDVGNFAYKMECSGDSCSITVDVFTFYGIHVDVGRWIPDPNL